MTIYFAWERTMTGAYQPVCYHGEKPGKGKDIVGLEVVPTDCMDMPGEPNLGRLVKRFPLEETGL